MSSKHLDDLRKMMEAKGLLILSEGSGDDLAVSAVWIVENRAGEKIRLIFEGMGDLSVFPIEQSYACRIDGDDARPLYFCKGLRKQTPSERIVSEQL
jgi:hypothetical protein